MNWLTNVVRPKIRSILRRETPENLWIKCPDSGQLVFYKDVEANQFVIPGSNYHMRMGAVARPSASRLPRKASTSAVPTTAPSAFSAIPLAASGVRMPKPTQTGSLVWRLIRVTASVTTLISAAALPVMPVMET